MPWPSAISAAGVGAMCTDFSPAQQRFRDPLLRATLSFPALLKKLPLSLPVPLDIPPSPKRHYRSQYVYRGYDDLRDPTAWATFSLFDLTLRLIDFSALEALLAQRVYAPSARGHVPFHPLSLFLLHAWRIDNDWPRTVALRNLAHPAYADYRQRFGFSPGIYPTEGGLRHFETRLGAETGDALIAQTVALARAAGCISPDAIAHGILGVDGMLHDAASRISPTASVEDSCSEPRPRPCPAKDKERTGCPCTDTACARVCQHATPRDPQARFIVYQGHNQTDSPNASATLSPRPGEAPLAMASRLRRRATDKSTPVRGQPRYGYRSVCERLIDPRYRTSWVLADALLTATAPEDKTATKIMEQVVERYAWVHWEFVVADAGEGRGPFLSTAYRRGLRRVIGLRADRSDANHQQWAIRGYDDKGIPVCPFGYRLHPNGWDPTRRRFKWCCRRTCVQETAQPAPECPHRTDADKHGLVRDVGRSFADGSTRLVRDVPSGSPFAKQLYARGRNAAEERNAEFADLGLKRMPVYGWKRVQTLLIVVDMWVNLKTIVRLMRETVLAAQGRSPP